jgi:mannitol-1-phosphate 5-dehydrogenase
MSASQTVIVGAGKIGRGFLAHLLWQARQPLVFIEAQADLVERLKAQGGYHIEIVGNPTKNAWIEGFEIWHWQDPQAKDRIVAADTLLTAVGAANLEAAGAQLAPHLATRARHRPHAPLNIITCENRIHAGHVLKDAILRQVPESDRQAVANQLGVAEATVLRSCMEPTPEQQRQDPFWVRAQDYWTLQIDRDALVAPLPPVPGLVAVADFHRALERKLYTYNAASATISFLGVLVGYRYLHDAARDPRILAVAQAVLAETSAAVCRRYGYSEAEQAAYAHSALRKYQNADIPDTLERNVRDPLRKLGRYERLVGAASLCLEVGIAPRAVALAIAAGLRYQEPSDPSAQALQDLLHRKGTDAVLEHVCGLDPRGELAQLIKARVADVDRFIRGESVV